jgi:hypothetical protein
VVELLGGTTTVVFAGGGGFELLMQPLSIPAAVSAPAPISAHNEFLVVILITLSLPLWGASR